MAAAVTRSSDLWRAGPHAQHRRINEFLRLGSMVAAQDKFNTQTLNGLGVREFLLSTTNAASFLALSSMVFVCACVKPKLQEFRESFSLLLPEKY
jgi:hypothetical protein